MKTKPMLGEFALDDIEYIESSESRALAEHRVPGLAGNYFQDMGAVANTIVIAGTKSGDEARDDFLNGIRAIFNKGEQTTFVADINTATDITDVIIEDLDVAEIGGSVHSFRYQLKLRKYTKPPEPPQTSLLDAGILGDALNVLDALNALDALSSIPNFGDPTGPIRGALDDLKGTTGGLDQAVGSVRNLLAQDVAAPGTAPGPQEGSGATPQGGDGDTAPSGTAPDQNQNGSAPSGTSGAPSEIPGTGGAPAPGTAGAPATGTSGAPGTAGGGPGVTQEQFDRLELKDEAPVAARPAGAAPGSVRAFAPAAAQGEETQAEETKAADTGGAESHRCEPGVPIEVGFVHFNNDRHVLMPEGPTPEPGTEAPASVDGLQVVASALDHARKHPKRQMLVTGHSDSTAIISYNLPLSARRADSTFCVLQGFDLKDLWVQSALRDGGHADDWRRILRWVDKTFHLDCEASDPNKPDAAKDQKAIANFQKGYNKEVDGLQASGANPFAPGFTKKIPGDQLGFPGLSTWQAFFDFYQRDLIRQLSLNTEAELAAIQKSVTLVKIPTQGCGEFHSRDLTERAARRAANYPEKPGPKDPRDRRVEILFFDPEEVPPFECHPTTDVNRCEPSKCVLYANQQFPQRQLPVLGAASTTTVELERIDVRLIGNDDFEEGRSYTPLVKEDIRFRVRLTGLSIPFDGKVRVTLGRETTDGLAAVSAVEVPICSDVADTTADVVWDGFVDRAVPRHVSKRTTPNLNPGASPTKIPLREMAEGDPVRHGVYAVQQIEVLEKDESVAASVNPDNGGFVVPVVCTLMFDTISFISSLGHFGIGENPNDAPYLKEIKRAIFIIASSHYEGIGIRFFTSITRTAARGIMVDIRETSIALEGPAGDAIPGFCRVQESGEGFQLFSNIFGWIDATFKSGGLNDDQFEIEVGPDGFLNRNLNQESSDSKTLNEFFGPLGVARDSQSQPFDTPAKTPKPTKPRTITNGKVDGRVTEVDVANTSVSVSDTGVIAISSTNPAVVPTERAADIQRGVNAIAHAVGIIAAHEFGHGLGLIAPTDRKAAHIAVEDQGIFLSPLAGAAGEHSSPPVGQLMDPGPAVKYRTIFTPGARLPLGDSIRRYLVDCFPAAP